LKKSSLLLTLLFSLIVCALFIIGVSAQTDFTDKTPQDNFTANSMFGYYTEPRHEQYFDDLTVYNATSQSYYTVFFVFDEQALYSEITAYISTVEYGSNTTFCDFIDFNTDYQGYSIIKNNDKIQSNFDDFRNSLNRLANSIHFFFTRNNENMKKYNNLNFTFKQLQEEFEEYKIQHPVETENNYQNLIAIHNELQASYDELQASYDELQASYEQLLITSDYNYTRYELLNSEYQRLVSEFDEMVQHFQGVITEKDLIIEEKQEAIFNLSATNSEILEEHSKFVDDYNELLENSKDSYNNGYNKGLEEAEALSNGLMNVFSAPMFVFGEVFNFEIFGINFFDIIKFILTIGIVGFVLRKIRS